MLKARIWSGLLLMALLGAGCDSGEEEEAHVDIHDTWVLTGVTDASGDKFGTFAQNFDGIRATFTEEDTYELVIDSKDNTLDQTLSGTTTVNEAARLLSIAVSLGGPSVNLSFTYVLQGETGLQLTGDSTVLNLLLATPTNPAPLSGTVQLIFTRQ